MTNKTLFRLSTFILAVCCFIYLVNKRPLKVETFDRPYKLTIVNEHEVRCIADKDTVILFFENSYVLCDETIVFIKK